MKSVIDLNQDNMKSVIYIIILPVILCRLTLSLIPVLISY